MASGDPISTLPRKTHRRHRRRPLILRFWWVLPIAGLLIAGPRIWSWIANRAPQPQSLAGYIADGAELQLEYLDFQGKPLDNPDIEQGFERAAELMREGSYISAAITLETTVQSAPLPVVFNDLGVLYVKLDDGPRAVAAFRDALARDWNYPPVRSNVLRLRYNADPLTHEVEPNGDNRQANVIALGKSIEADISSTFADVDCFRFTSPAAPRDVLAIELANRSQTLAPRMQVYDFNGRLLDWSAEGPTPGASLRELISPPPNTTFYIHLEGIGGSSGAYSLTVVPLKAFDAYEPNDEITRATPLTLDRTIDANIMDGEDTDFYSFAVPAGREAAIEIRNRSTTLIPGVTTFSTDLRNTGFGPDVRTAGADLHHTLKGEPGATVYIQVWGQGKTAGTYSLTVK
jgi:hypothetical protein